MDSTNTDAPLYRLSVTELATLQDLAVEHLLEALPDGTLQRGRGGQLEIPPASVRDYLSHQGVNYDFQVVAHINLKGGVGKTTTSVSLATRAAQYGFRCCLLDLDSQASATLALGVEPGEEQPVFVDIWQNPGDFLPGTLHTLQPGLSLFPSSLDNALLDVNLMNPSAQKQAVRSVCEKLREDYDLVVIDCPPSLGAAVVSAACAADTVVIPLGFDAFSRRGLALTLQEIREIRHTFGLPQPTVRLLLTLFDRRVKLALSRLEELQSHFGDALIPTPIHTSTQFPKAVDARRSVFAAGHASGPARGDYDAYTRHLLGLDQLLPPRKSR